ncbi:MULTISPECIES: hypothetical protein [unclassified Mycolicibacterium]|uniref:hypothetical protein n=1 Tax=unclassified Mycolicibacterium TaxID=2636767 RepID=UPI002EDB53E1
MAPALCGDFADMWYYGGANPLSGGDGQHLDRYLQADPVTRWQMLTTSTAVHGAARAAGAQLARPPATRCPQWKQMPALHITGRFDFCRTATLNAYTAGVTASDALRHLIIDPWTHTVEDSAGIGLADDPPSLASSALAHQLAFLYSVLELPGAIALPAVKTYVLGDDRWCAHEAWTPPGLRSHTLYLSDA